MKSEISAAVIFLTRLVKKNENLSGEQIEEFSKRLSSLLGDRFKNHWYQDDPQKGQAYRCIRMNETSIRDPVIEQAAVDCGLVYGDLNLPTELTLWVDPKEVCCRFGENKGSWCTLFKEGKDDPLATGQIVDRVLSQSQQKTNSNKPFEVTRINNRSNSTSPPTGYNQPRFGGYHGMPMGPSNSNNSNVNMRNGGGGPNFHHNHNHNNNQSKFNKHHNGAGKFRGGPPPSMGAPPPPPPPPPPHGKYRNSGSPTFMKGNKTGPAPPPSKFNKPPPSAFQQRLSSSRGNDRFHWVRGADLVKA